MRGEIEKVAHFTGKKLSEELLDRLTEHLRFDAFSKNATVNLDWTKQLGIMKDDGHFIRKGEPNLGLRIRVLVEPGML